MGVLTSSRIRGRVRFRDSPSLDLSDFDHVSKKRRVSVSGDDTPTTSSRSSVNRFYLYPEAKHELPRAVHAPVKSNRFGLWKRCFFGSGDVSSADKMGNSLSNSINILKSKYAKASREALESFRHVVLGEVEDEVVEVRGEGRIGVSKWWDKEKGTEVIVLDDEATKEDVTEGSSIEEVEMRIEKEQPVVHQRDVSMGVVGNLVDGKRGVSSPVMGTEDLSVKALSLSVESNKWSRPLYAQLLDSTQKRDPKLQELSFQIKLKEKFLQGYRFLRPQKKVKDVKQDVVREAFMPLSDEDKCALTRAFAKSNRRKILVSHEKSNIDITGEVLQCLRPGAWLNDEVINVYLELLKERENREPQKFLKCHFLNTFFYKKLIGGNGGYNFQAVRRWTTQRKLGYCLSDCDKIFVPIHKEVHWCLGVINKKDRKFQYLDSLGGRDDKVMKVLASYYVDEVKEKTGNTIDVSSWGHEFVEDLPEQENGYDCGVFMIKYADFYSRGGGLHFKQEHMPYFRERTAMEILRLKAE